MITVKIEVQRVQYERLPDYKDKIHRELLKKALYVAETNNEELDLSSSKFTVEPVGQPDQRCGCTKTVNAILSIEFVKKVVKARKTTKSKGE